MLVEQCEKKKYMQMNHTKIKSKQLGHNIQKSPKYFLKKKNGIKYFYVKVFAHKIIIIIAMLLAQFNNLRHIDK